MVAFEAVALARAATLLALLVWARVASGAHAGVPPPLDAPAAADRHSAARQLLSSPPASVGTIYNNGLLEWRSWSWGLSQLDVHATTDPMPGARSSLCLAVQPYGALSLRSAMPFPLTGMLGFYVRGAANASAAQLGELEIQMEGSSPGRYTYTRSLSLADILSAQAGGSAAAAAQVLDGMASGRWTAVKTPLAAFAPPAAAADAGAADGAAAGASPFRADRLTIGVCLQRLDRCSAASGVLELCLDKLVLVGGR